MAVGDIHSLHGVLLDTVKVGGITAISMPTGTELQNEPASGETAARFQTVMAQKHTPTFTTKAIAAALDKVGTQGWTIAAAFLVMYMQKWAPGAGRAAGSTHKKVVYNSGLVIPDSLSVSHGDDASLSCAGHITFNGTTSPAVETTAVALLTGFVENERFGLGAVTVAGITIASVTSVELSFGLDVVARGSDGDIWDTHVALRSIQPILTIRGMDVSLAEEASFPLAKYTAGTQLIEVGKICTHANTNFYLRKRDDSGYVADTTAEHIQFTMAGYAHVENVIDANGNETGESTLIVTSYNDGTDDPLKVDTTIVYP